MLHCSFDQPEFANMFTAWQAAKPSGKIRKRVGKGESSGWLMKALGDTVPLNVEGGCCDATGSGWVVGGG